MKYIVGLVASMMVFFGLASNGVYNYKQNKGDMALTVQVRQDIVATPISKHNDTAAFMDVLNKGNKQDRLIAGYTPVAEKVQLHEFVNDQMVQMREFDIAKHSELDLKPHNFHIMLINLKRPLKVGEKIPLTLIFSDGSWETIFPNVVDRKSLKK